MLDCAFFFGLIRGLKGMVEYCGIVFLVMYSRGIEQTFLHYIRAF